MIDVKLNLDPLRLALTELEREAFPYAARQSVNRTAAALESKAIADVSKAMGIQRKPVRQSFSRTRASLKHLVAVVTASGREIALIHFNARPVKAGVSHTAWAGRKLAKGVFIVKLKSGHRGVFKRTSKKRLPIKELWGPSVPKVMADEALAGALQRFGGERLEREMRQNLKFYVEKTINKHRGK